jgi:hypothetical protein
MMNLTYDSIKTNSLEAFPPLELGFSLSEAIHKQHTAWIEDGTYYMVKLTIIFTLSYVWSVVKPLTIQTIRAINEVMDDYIQASMAKKIEGDRPEIIEAETPSETLGKTLTEEDFTRRDLLLLAKTFKVVNYSRKSKSEIFLALKMQGNIPEKI